MPNSRTVTTRGLLTRDRIDLHFLCECQTPSRSHAPGQCSRDSDRTCGVCGRAVCDQCYTHMPGGRGVRCFSCAPTLKGQCSA